MLVSKAPLARTAESLKAVSRLALGLGCAIGAAAYASYYLFPDPYVRIDLGTVMFIALLFGFFSTWHLVVFRNPIRGVLVSLAVIASLATIILYLAGFIDPDAWAVGDAAGFAFYFCGIIAFLIVIVSFIYHLKPKRSPFIVFAVLFFYLMARTAYPHFLDWIIRL